MGLELYGLYRKYVLLLVHQFLSIRYLWKNIRGIYPLGKNRFGHTLCNDAAKTHVLYTCPNKNQIPVEEQGVLSVAQGIAESLLYSSSQHAKWQVIDNVKRLTGRISTKRNTVKKISGQYEFTCLPQIHQLEYLSRIDILPRVWSGHANSGHGCRQYRRGLWRNVNPIGS